jgi:hypothetical protein
MSLRNLMLEDLERGLAIFRAGHEIVPSWRILSPEGDFVIVTRFDPDKPDQREQMLALVPRLMAWKLATAFVLTTESWLGPERTHSGEEAVLSIGVSRHERLGVIRPCAKHQASNSRHRNGFLLTRSMRIIFGCCPMGKASSRPKRRRCWRPCSGRTAKCPRGR